MKKVSGFFLAHRLGSGQVEIGANMIESWRIPVQAKQEGSWCKQRRRTEVPAVGMRLAEGDSSRTPAKETARENLKLLQTSFLESGIWM